MAEHERFGPAGGALPAEDVRRVVRLLGEVSALRGSVIERKRALLDGMAELVNADYVAWVLAAATVAGEQPIYVGFETRGISADQMTKFLRIQAHPALAAYSETLLTALRETGAQVTGNVQDAFNYEEFHRSEWGQMWEEADILPRCIVHRPLAGGGVSGIGCYRRRGTPLFTERERLLVHLLLSEISWLHEMGWPEDRGAKVPDLPPRCWLVHEMMLQGMNRSLIAARLGISEHTVGGYSKQIFRSLEVSSQSELMARFFVRAPNPPGKRPTWLGSRVEGRGDSAPDPEDV